MNHDSDLDTGDRVGYARVSTDRQDLSNQQEKLQQADCVRIFSEKITEAKRNRPELRSLLDYLWTRDMVVVTRLNQFPLCDAPES